MKTEFPVDTEHPIPHTINQARATAGRQTSSEREVGTEMMDMFFDMDCFGKPMPWRTVPCLHDLEPMC